MRRSFLCFVLVFCILVSAFCFAIAEPASSVEGVLVTNHAGVRLRDKASHGKIIAVINRAGTPLEFLDKVYVEEILWYHVMIEGVEGYVYGDYAYFDPNVDQYAESISEGTALDPNGVYVELTGEKLNLRDWPNGKLITPITGVGTVLEMLKPSQLWKEPWYYVKYGDYTGYVFANYVRPYDVSSVSHSAIRLVDDGDYVSRESISSVIESIVDSVSDNVGNVSEIVDAIATDNRQESQESASGVVYVLTTGSSVNFREAPNGTVITAIKNAGTKVVALDPNEIGVEKWYHVLYDGTEGFCSAKYLEVDPESYANWLNGVPADTASESVSEEHVEATVEPTVESTVAPTLEPTPEPTVAPILEPTVEPTEESADEPVESPMVAPTATPYVETYGTVETDVAVEDVDEDVHLYNHR